MMYPPFLCVAAVTAATVVTDLVVKANLDSLK